MEMTKRKDIRKWFVTAAVLFLSVMWGSCISPDEAVRNAANASAYSYIGKMTDEWNGDMDASALAAADSYNDYIDGDTVYIVIGSPDGGYLYSPYLTIKNSSGSTVKSASDSSGGTSKYYYMEYTLDPGVYSVTFSAKTNSGTNYTYSANLTIHRDMPETWSGNVGNTFSFDALSISDSGASITYCISDTLLSIDDIYDDYGIWSKSTMIKQGTSVSFDVTAAMNGAYVYYVLVRPDGNGTYSWYRSGCTKISTGGSGSSSSGTTAQSINVSSSMTKTLGSGSFNIIPTGNIFTYLSFKSSNTSVANVTSFGSYGRVDMKKPGQTKITISAPATSEYKAASKTVTVKVVCSKPKVKVKVKNGRMTISWNKVKGAAKYKVSITQHGVKTTTLPLTSKRKISNIVKKGKKYTIKVKALDSTKKYGSAWAKKTVKS